MANELDHATGSSIAAFTLVQQTFWYLLEQGVLPKVEAERMLQMAIQANKIGGPGNQIAAEMLSKILENVRGHQAPQKH
jgi:hypothetical protein